MTSPKKPRSLGPHDIAVARVGRRSALAALGALGASALTTHAEAKATDSDANDRPGRGRTGLTDRDAGSGSDGVGRGVCAERGVSDSDPSDAEGRGRGPCH